MQKIDINPGNYDSPQVVRHTLDKTPTKGTQLVRVTFRVLYEGGEYYSDVEWAGWLSDGAIDRTLDSLEWMGWSGADILELEHGDLNAGTCRLTGDGVSIDVKTEEYDGKTQTRVNFVNRLGAADFDASGPNARIAARRRQQGSPMPSKPAAPAKAARPAAPPPTNAAGEVVDPF